MIRKTFPGYRLIVIAILILAMSSCVVRLKNPPRKRTIIYRTSFASFYLDADLVLKNVSDDLSQLPAKDSTKTVQKIAEIKALAPGDSIWLYKYSGYPDIDRMVEKIIKKKVKTGQLSIWDIRDKTWVKKIRIKRQVDVSCHKTHFLNKENGNDLWSYARRCAKGH